MILTFLIFLLFRWDLHLAFKLRMNAPRKSRFILLSMDQPCLIGQDTYAALSLHQSGSALIESGETLVDVAAQLHQVV